jgi:hypothetical protein
MPQATTCLAPHFGSRFRLQLIESEVCIAWQLWADSGHALGMLAETHPSLEHTTLTGLMACEYELNEMREASLYPALRAAENIRLCV